MRALLASFVLTAVATSAAAQPTTPYDIIDLRARQEAAERAAVARANELQSLEARLQAEQAVQDLQAQRRPPSVPTLRYEPAPGATSAAVTAKYPSMPDAALADSNRRVQDAAANRR